jgi:manganese/zinc/iron transport system permease protein
MVVLAAGFGAVGGIAGALLSASARNLATGPLIVLAITALVLVSLLIAPERGLVWEALQRRRDRARLRARQVLTTLYRLSGRHDDPHYPTEQGMVNAYYGVGTEATLQRLEERGLVERVRHMPEEGAHWELTDAGRDEAEQVLRDLGAGSRGVP